jgi:hypothetical protein
MGSSQLHEGTYWGVATKWPRPNSGGAQPRPRYLARITFPDGDAAMVAPEMVEPVDGGELDG